MAILKQVVDLQETVKRLMEQNAKLRGERDAMKDHIERYGDLCMLCKHGERHYYNADCDAANGDCTKCEVHYCPCRECVKTDNAKGYEWDGGSKNEP